MSVPKRRCTPSPEKATCAKGATCPPPNLLAFEVGAGTCLACGSGRCNNQTLHVAKHGTAPTFDVQGLGVGRLQRVPYVRGPLLFPPRLVSAATLVHPRCRRAAGFMRRISATGLTECLRPKQHPSCEGWVTCPASRWATNASRFCMVHDRFGHSGPWIRFAPS